MLSQDRNKVLLQHVRYCVDEVRAISHGIVGNVENHYVYVLKTVRE